MEATDHPKKAPIRIRVLDLGLAATLAFGVFTVYTYLHEKEVGIDFELASQFDAFSLNTPISDLKIIFDGKDIQASRQNLRVYSLRVSNSGQVDIVEGMYDSEEDWGVSVTGGKIVACALVAGDTDFLRRKMASLNFSADRLTLPKCIIDRRRGFVINVTVLHRTGETPALQAFGKVAGIDQLGPIRSALPARDSLFARALGGPFAAHVVRSVVYGCVMLALLLAVILVQNFWDGRRQARIDQLLRERAVEAAGVGADDPVVKRFLDDYTRGVVTTSMLEEAVARPDLWQDEVERFLGLGYAVRTEDGVEVAQSIQRMITVLERREDSRPETPKVVA